MECLELAMSDARYAKIAFKELHPVCDQLQQAGELMQRRSTSPRKYVVKRHDIT
jgi:hypothetical protein